MSTSIFVDKTKGVAVFYARGKYFIFKAPANFDVSAFTELEIKYKILFGHNPSIIHGLLDSSTEGDGSITVVFAPESNALAKYSWSLDDLKLISPFNSAEDGVRGMIAYIASSGKGKSTVLERATEAGYFDDLMILGEPDDVAISVDFIDQFLLERRRSNILGLINGTAVPRAVIAVDSLREKIYDQKGAALTSGLSSGIFKLLTRLSNEAIEANVCLVTVVNPMIFAGDAAAADALFRSFVELARSSATGVLVVDETVSLSVRGINNRIWSDHETVSDALDLIASGKVIDHESEDRGRDVEDKSSDFMPGVANVDFDEEDVDLLNSKYFGSTTNVA